MSRSDETDCLEFIDFHSIRGSSEINSFEVDNAEKANWIARRVQEARAYRARVQAWACNEIALSERHEQNLLSRYGPQIQRWLIAELNINGGRRRSVSLPAGVVGFRRERPSVVIDDENQLTEWCQRHLKDAVQVHVHGKGGAAIDLTRLAQGLDPDLVCKVSILRSVLTQYVTSSGEVPDGASLSEPADRFYIR